MKKSEQSLKDSMHQLCMHNRTEGEERGKKEEKKRINNG
jgi:hypothetical protein